MSDIAIRFDGLLLAAALALAGALYLVIALAAAIAALFAGIGRGRLLSAARRAALYGLLSAAGLAAVVSYLVNASPPIQGPDLIDWLALPTAILFAAGCRSLWSRVRE